MINLLPDIKKSIAKKAELPHTLWNLDDAHPVTGKVSFQLESQFTTEYQIPVIKYAENKKPLDEPNIKHADPALVAAVDASHLSKAQRGIADATQLSMKPIKDGLMKSKSYKVKADPVNVYFACRMFNDMTVSMDLFVQRKLSILCSVVNPGHHCTRLISGEAADDETSREDNIAFYFSTLKRATVTITSRQQVKDFHFNATDPIGLEIELSNGRLVCTKVLPDCQASPYALQLDGAEVIAVNGHRVTDLEEFGAAMRLAKDNHAVTAAAEGGGRTIILKIAAYKGGRGKLDDLYMHDAKKTEQVKSLFSNILGGGGGGMRGFDYNSSDDEEDDDDDENESQDTSTVDGSAPVNQGDRTPNSVNSRRSRKHRGGSIKDGNSHANSRRRVSSEAQQKGGELEDLAEMKLSPAAWEHLEEYPDAPPILTPTAATTTATNSNGAELDEQAEERGSMRAGKTRRKSDDNSVLAKSASGSMRSNRRRSVDSTASYDSSESWNQLTKLEDIYPYKLTVCTPPVVANSEAWGDPDRLLQVSNFSSRWLVQLYWLDENGAFIEKGEVASGSVLSLPCSIEHVWGITAAAKVKSSKRTDASSVEGVSLAAPSMEGASVAVESTYTGGDAAAPALLLIKPNAASLGQNKCTSVIWTPFASASVTQRVQSQQKDKDSGSSGSTMGLMSRHNLHPTSQSEPPHMHLQILDGAAAARATTRSIAAGSVSGGSLAYESLAESTSNAYKLDKIKLAKWPRKKTAKR